MSCSVTERRVEHATVHRQVKRAELYAVAVKQAEAQLLLRVDALQVKTSEGEMAAAERQQRQKEARDEVESLRKGLSMMVREREFELCEPLFVGGSELGPEGPAGRKTKGGGEGESQTGFSLCQAAAVGQGNCGTGRHCQHEM